MILLDINVLSEVLRPAPNAAKLALRSASSCSPSELTRLFRPNFEPTPYDQNPGAAAIFVDIAGIGSDLALRIEEHLGETCGEDSEDNPYDYSTGFRRCRTPQFWQEERWARFCNTLRKTVRHINAEAIA